MAGQTRIVVTSLTRFVEQVVQKIVLDITARLQETTPVDTGWARSNWIPRISEAFTGTAGSREAVSGTVQAQGIASLLGYKLRQGTVHVTNNVPYIVRLNEGSSQQAPAGFVQDAIEQAVRVDLARALGRTT